LLGIAAFALLLYAWHLKDAGLAPFYSTAVKSMSVSWKAFFYGAFDPAATITIDKLAGSFLPQALSARIFGFHPWSLALPQVIEGVVSVLVMYRVVRRWSGVVPGLLAAGIFAITPVAASMFGHSMEDGALTMCLVLAADAYQTAVLEARLRPLIGAGVWVGLGFQAKMLQAWMVLPALAVGYLICAPTSWRRRLWQLGTAGAVMLAVSLSWIALYTFTPAQDRPYVDGSTSNSAFAMVFGYNGLERFGINVPGAVSSGPGITGGTRALGRAATQLGAGRTSGLAAAGGPGGPTAAGGGAPHVGGGLTKLIGSGFGPEIAWLLPLALLTLLFGLLASRRARRTDQYRAGLIMWGTWLVTFGVIYSIMSVIPHTAYVAALAAPLAALSGTGIVMFARWYRSGDARGWVLPAAIAIEVGWALYLWSGYPTFLPWVKSLIVAAGVIAVAALVFARLSRATSRKLAIAALAAGAAVMLAAPATWASSVLDTRYAGSSFDASAGPAGGYGSSGGGSQPRGAALGGAALGGAGRYGPGTGELGGPGGTPPGGTPPGGTPPGGGFPGGAPGGSGPGRLPGQGQGLGTFPGRAGGAAGGPLSSATTTLTSSEQKLYNYLSAHRDGAKYLLAVESWNEASPFIIATGQEVMPIGGFSGSVPSPTLARFKELVSTGELKFILLNGSGRGSGGPGGGTSTQASSISAWVSNHCTVVPAKDYSSTSAGTTQGTLYACAA
jgi:4-amino-4-deoxy-L-arabinose transferase-like glycosyltransferase